ncbi:MAG TPA: hypothetical protein VF533_19535, partial [Solirubrobacteraceae bacterium]
ALAIAGPAAADGPLDAVMADWRADGEIDACAYTAAGLQAARAAVPADVVAYAPDFVAAVDRAIADNARCAVAVPPPDKDGNAGKQAKGKAKGVPAACRKLGGRKRARCVKDAKATARCKAMKHGKKRSTCLKKAAAKRKRHARR